MMKRICVQKILTMSLPATWDHLSKVRMYVHLLAFYAMHKKTMIYYHYHLSPEFDSVKFKHKTTHCSWSPPGKVCGLLQLMSAWHEQHAVKEIPWSQQLHLVHLHDLLDVHLHEITWSRSLGANTMIPYIGVGGMLLPLVFHRYFEMSMLGGLISICHFPKHGLDMCKFDVLF